MPRNDDGEFELILGNKQLLSVFFIVIILLGVFFTMGYIVGRNSGAPETAKQATPIDAKPAEQAAGQSAMPPAATPAPTVVEPVASSSEPPRLPHKDPIEVSAVTHSIAQPIPGQIYIQVLAVARPEAEVLVDVLSKKGFHAMVSAGPNDKIYRVLVGPAKDASDAGKLKGDLEQAGFKLAFAKKF
ncbi:MAG: SPOR domain-containing protein [Bryobacteraceae bacterium]